MIVVVKIYLLIADESWEVEKLNRSKYCFNVFFYTFQSVYVRTVILNKSLAP